MALFNMIFFRTWCYWRQQRFFGELYTAILEFLADFSPKKMRYGAIQNMIKISRTDKACDSNVPYVFIRCMVLQY